MIIIAAYVLTYVYLSQDRTTFRKKVDTLQVKVDTVQHKVMNLEDKLDTFQNTTQASPRKNHHEVVELLQNTSCSLDGKT